MRSTTHLATILGLADVIWGRDQLMKGKGDNVNVKKKRTVTFSMPTQKKYLELYPRFGGRVELLDLGDERRPSVAPVIDQSESGEYLQDTVKFVPSQSRCPQSSCHESNEHQRGIELELTP